MKHLNRIPWHRRVFEYVGPQCVAILIAWRERILWVFARDNGPVLFVGKTALFSVLIIFAILVPLNLMRYWLSAQPEEADVVSLPVLGALIIGPLIENAFLVGLIELLALFEMRRSTIVIIVAGLSGVAHGLVGGWQAVSGVTSFMVMAVSYFIWSDRRALARYFITVAQHSAVNVPPVLLSLLLA